MTTQISELKNKISKVKIAAKPNEKTGTDNNSNGKPWGNFEQWHHTKVNNGADFNMVKKDGKNYIGATSINTLETQLKGCMFFINQLIIIQGQLRKRTKK